MCVSYALHGPNGISLSVIRHRQHGDADADYFVASLPPTPPPPCCVTLLVTLIALCFWCPPSMSPEYTSRPCQHISISFHICLMCVPLSFGSCLQLRCMFDNLHFSLPRPECYNPVQLPFIPFPLVPPLRNQLSTMFAFVIACAISNYSPPLDFQMFWEFPHFAFGNQCDKQLSSEYITRADRIAIRISIGFRIVNLTYANQWLKA